MKQITGITSEPFQKWKTSIDQGTIEFKLTFRPAIQMWFLDLKFGTFEVKSLRVCHSLNLLHQFKKILPFGLFIHIPDGVEPFLIDDFSSERVMVGIIDNDVKDAIDLYYREQKDLIEIA